MKLFEATKEFDLEQHFDESKQPDIRIRLHELYQRTKKAVAQEHTISLEVTLLIGLLVPSEVEVIIASLEDLIEKRDPQRKAERADVRAKKKAEVWSLTAAPQSIASKISSTGAPGKFEHSITSITSITPRGRKNIPAAHVHADHIAPVAFGQDNRLVNLRLLCRQCNISEAQRILGGRVMDRYQWLRTRKTEGGFGVDRFGDDRF